MLDEAWIRRRFLDTEVDVSNCQLCQFFSLEQDILSASSSKSTQLTNENRAGITS